MYFKIIEDETGEIVSVTDKYNSLEEIAEKFDGISIVLGTYIKDDKLKITFSNLIDTITFTVVESNENEFIEYRLLG